MALILFSGACATHAPMSEMVMFTPKKVIKHTVYDDTVAVHYSKYSFAVGIEGRGIPSEKLELYADKKFRKEGFEGEPVYNYANSASLHSIFMFNNVDGFAVNISMLPTIGIDFTAKIYRDYYLTYAETITVGSQIYLQRRLLYNNTTGVAAGIFYEQAPLGYEYDEESGCPLCFGPDEMFYLNVLGIRAFYMSHDGTKNRNFFKIQSKLGYIVDYGGAFGQVGISFGIF